MLTRCLFALLALAALVIFFSPAPGGIPEAEPWLRKLLLVGIWLTGIGMAVPWGRWMPFVSPGTNLAFVSKLLGWGGASGLPFFLACKAWLVAGVCVLLPVCAFAMWKRRAWAAWLWYAFALGAFGISITIAIVTSIVVASESDLGTDDVIWVLLIYGIPLVWILCWGGFGFVLMSEVPAWRRNLRSESGASGSPSAS